MKCEKIKKRNNKFVLYQLPEAYSGFRPQWLLVCQPIILEKKYFFMELLLTVCAKNQSHWSQIIGMNK